MLVYLGVSMITGLGLALYYDASPLGAYRSVVDMESTFGLAQVLRGLHFFSAQCLIVAAMVHFIATLVAAPAMPSRKGVWLSGVAATLLIIMSAFSGRILPFDEHGAISLEMAGTFLGVSGTSTSVSTVSDGSSWLTSVLLVHVVIGVAILICLSFHFRIDDILFQRREGSAHDLGRGGCAILLGGVICLLSLTTVFYPPLGLPFNGLEIRDDASAEWYLRWAQVLSESSVTLARLSVVGLLVFAFLTPLLSPRIGWRIVRVLWISSLVIVVGITVLDG